MKQNINEKKVKVPFYKTKVFGDRTFALGMTIFALVDFFLFFVYLNIDTILLTFKEVNYLKNTYQWCDGYFGFENYVEIFQDYILGYEPAKRQTLLNSFIPLTLTIIAFPMSYICGFALYKKIKCERFFRIVFYMPSLISASVLCMSYRYMFYSEFGPIAKIVELFTGEPVMFFGSDSPYLWPMMYIYGLFIGLGGNAITMCAAMNRIPQEVIESAQLDGITFWKEAFLIVFPLAMPTLSAFLIAMPLGLFGFVMPPLLIAQTNGVQNKFVTLGLVFYQKVKSPTKASLVECATLGVMFSVLWSPAIYGTRWLINKITPKDVEY